jgi:diguanylate cyclase (GGDEF)-like protein
MTGKKNSVLIVDDESANISGLTAILSPEYTVYASSDGREAVETAEEFLPDVILLDVLMPGMDGYAVIAALKSSEKTREIPVVFITGLDNAGAEEKGLALGAADYIAKPFNSAIVKLRVQRQLEITNRTHALKERLEKQQAFDLTKIRELEKEAEKIYYDGLTGIYNRRYLDEAMVRVLKSSSRSKSTLSLMMIDIDFFKHYNDTYGHSAGDDCLKTVAGIFSKCLLRSDDFVARYGGEEFVAVLPNTDENGARTIADKLLESVRRRNILHENSAVADHVTVSIGVATGEVVHTQMADDFIKLADKMLYKSKQGGRDRYSFESLRRRLAVESWYLNDGQEQRHPDHRRRKREYQRADGHTEPGIYRLRVKRRTGGHRNGRGIPAGRHPA